jgi:UDP:flavonoid glycosyltransferase YjiC (YdhE family)
LRLLLRGIDDFTGSPQLRAMITHGGHLSIQETVSHGVPVIVFPIFANQDYHAYKVEETGRGLWLEISELTVPKLEKAISEVVMNGK